MTESESVVQISNKLNEAITISKVLINNNIDCLINDEYIIDRSSEISQIRKDGFNFITSYKMKTFFSFSNPSFP